MHISNHFQCLNGDLVKFNGDILIIMKPSNNPISAEARFFFALSYRPSALPTRPTTVSSCYVRPYVSNNTFAQIQFLSQKFLIYHKLLNVHLPNLFTHTPFSNAWTHKENANYIRHVLNYIIYQVRIFVTVEGYAALQ